MAAFKTFEEINAWQNARVLVREVYAMTGSGDFSKDYGLKDQIQRAAVSICSNIAEGFERRGNKEFINFLWIAKGSALRLFMGGLVWLLSPGRPAVCAVTLPVLAAATLGED
jgi:hypothetical protein